MSGVVMAARASTSRREGRKDDRSGPHPTGAFPVNRAVRAAESGALSAIVGGGPSAPLPSRPGAPVFLSPLDAESFERPGFRPDVLIGSHLERVVVGTKRSGASP